MDCLALPKFGAPMTYDVFNELVQTIRREHRFGVSGKSGKMVKYITPTLDLRDDMVFRVTFRGFFNERTFDFRDNEKPMIENIMAWLQEEAL